MQIVISHPEIIGPYPKIEQIISNMEENGFVMVPNFTMGAAAPSFYNHQINIAVFDASEDNFILSNGISIPIDIIPIAPELKLKKQLLLLIESGDHSPM